jgi:hypothetical protein
MNGGWNKRSIIVAKKEEIKKDQREIKILQKLKINVLYEYKTSEECYYIVIPEFNNFDEINYIVLAATASLMGRSSYHFTSKFYGDYGVDHCKKALIIHFENLRAVKRDELLLLVGLPYKTPIFEALFKSEGKIKLEG